MLSDAGILPRTFGFDEAERLTIVTPENVILTAVKKAEDSNSLIFRVFEWACQQSDVTFTVPESATAATETNLMEKPQGSPLPVTNNKVTVPISPYEILSIRVDYPHN